MGYGPRNESLPFRIVLNPVGNQLLIPEIRDRNLLKIAGSRSGLDVVEIQILVGQVAFHLQLRTAGNLRYILCKGNEVRHAASFRTLFMRQHAIKHPFGGVHHVEVGGFIH